MSAAWKSKPKSRIRYGWVRVISGQHLCAECGCFVSTAWLYYANATKATLCYCEACAEALAHDAAASGSHLAR